MSGRAIEGLYNVDLGTIPDNELPLLYWDACVNRISALENIDEEGGVYNAQIAEYTVYALKKACRDRGYILL